MVPFPSPYLLSRRGFLAEMQPLRLTPHGDELTGIGFSDPIFNLPEMVFRPHKANSPNKFPELNRKTNLRQMTPKNHQK